MSGALQKCKQEQGGSQVNRSLIERVRRRCITPDHPLKIRRCWSRPDVYLGKPPCRHRVPNYCLNNTEAPYLRFEGFRWRFGIAFSDLKGGDEQYEYEKTVGEEKSRLEGRGDNREERQGYCAKLVSS